VQGLQGRLEALAEAFGDAFFGVCPALGATVEANLLALVIEDGLDPTVSPCPRAVCRGR
jgi:hypothetical protein